MLSHHRTLIFVFVVGRLFFVHCLQPGHANLGGCLKFFAGLDFEEIMSKKASATLTGRMLRNQLYYEFATFAGVKGAGNNVAAPQYIRAACNAALPYGRDDEIPQVHIDAYHASAMPEDDDLARALKSTPCLFSLFSKPFVLENKTRKAKKQTTVLFEIKHSTTPAIFFL